MYSERPVAPTSSSLQQYCTRRPRKIFEVNGLRRSIPLWSEDKGEGGREGRKERWGGEEDHEGGGRDVREMRTPL